MLTDFHRAHAQVEITLSEDNSDRLVEELQEGRLELAFVATAGPLRGILGAGGVRDSRCVGQED